MSNSLKEKIKYWFEFLKLAHQSSDPVVKTNLKQAASFYAQWDNYRDVRFDSWWKEHSKLFRTNQTLSVPKVGDIVDTEAFYLRVPFTYAPSTVGRIVTEMFGRELEKRSVRTTKMRKVYGGTYSLTRDDYQVAQFYYYFIFVRDVYLPLRISEPTAKTGRYIEKSEEVFGKVKRQTTKVRLIPFTDEGTSYESRARLVRRYRLMAEKLLRNVAKGEFPGDYEETFIKTQSQIRADKAAKAFEVSGKKRRGVRGVVTGAKGIDGDDPYAGIARKTRSDKGKKRGGYATQ